MVERRPARAASLSSETRRFSCPRGVAVLPLIEKSSAAGGAGIIRLDCDPVVRNPRRTLCEHKNTRDLKCLHPQNFPCAFKKSAVTCASFSRFPPAHGSRLQSSLLPEKCHDHSICWYFRRTKRRTPPRPFMHASGPVFMACPRAWGASLNSDLSLTGLCDGSTGIGADQISRGTYCHNRQFA